MAIPDVALKVIPSAESALSRPTLWGRDDTPAHPDDDGGAVDDAACRVAAEAGRGENTVAATRHPAADATRSRHLGRLPKLLVVLNWLEELTACVPIP